MAVTNSTSTSFVEVVSAINTQGAGNLFRRAMDGDREASQKIAGDQDGGADLILTADSSAAEAVVFTVPFASLLKLYAASVSNVTQVVIKARTYVTSAVNVAANTYYWENAALFVDVAGTLTQVSTTQNIVAIEGTASTDPVLAASTTNVTVTINTTGATAKSVRCELTVQHIK